MTRFKAVACGLAWLGLCSGCGLNVDSQWTNRPIKIDGRDLDWSGVPEAKAGGISFKAMNDSETLYLCLSTSNRDAKRQLAGAFYQSLKLWFDPKFSAQKQTGLSLGFASASQEGYPLLAKAESDYVASAKGSLAIERPGVAGYPKALDTQNPAGIAAAIGADEGILALELKLPLAAAQGFELALAPGQRIGIGIETTEINSNMAKEELARESELSGTRERPRSGGGGGGGGRGGRHGHRGGGEGGGGMPPSTGGRENATEPSNFIYWGTLSLAKAPHG